MHSTHLLRAALVFAMSLSSVAVGCGSDSTTGASTATSGDGGSSASSSSGDATSSGGDSTSSSTGGDPAATSYVLVHGAWQGAWVWDAVATGLKAKGATVSVVELPAHGADTTPLADATLDTYAAKVEAAIDAASSPVVLVGHSLGGMVISVAAEQRADKIAKLVYVGAYLPKDGDSLFSLAQTDAGSHLGGGTLAVDMTAGTADVPMGKLDDIFCADCGATALESLHAHYRTEPLAPLVGTAHLTAAAWGKIAKYYVYTKQDHAVSYEFQKTMTSAVTLVSTAELDTGHSPFLSSPDLLTTALLGF